MDHSPAKGRTVIILRKRNEDGSAPQKCRTPSNDGADCSSDIRERSIKKERHQGLILRKEVIQPQVPLRLPCYDFTPVADLTVAACLPKVSAASSGKTNSHGVTGGVYKARERIHRGMLIRDY